MALGRATTPGTLTASSYAQYELARQAMGVPGQLLNAREEASKDSGVGTFLGDIGVGIGSLFG